MSKLQQLLYAWIRRGDAQRTRLGGGLCLAYRPDASGRTHQLTLSRAGREDAGGLAVGPPSVTEREVVRSALRLALAAAYLLRPQDVPVISSSALLKVARDEEQQLYWFLYRLTWLEPGQAKGEKHRERNSAPHPQRPAGHPHGAAGLHRRPHLSG